MPDGRVLDYKHFFNPFQRSAAAFRIETSQFICSANGSKENNRDSGISDLF